MEKIYELSQTIVNGDIDQAKAITTQLLEAGEEAQKIIDGAFIPGMERVGKMFQENEMFVPEMLMSAKAMQDAMRILEPFLKESDKASKVKFVLGTVAGDLHDIGKDLVGMMLEGAGFEVIDLGVDVDEVTFVEAIKKHKSPLLGMSGLLTTTMPKMKSTIEAIVDAGLRDKVKIMIGGAPVTQDFAKAIGADAYAPDAGSATEVAKKLSSQ